MGALAGPAGPRPGEPRLLRGALRPAWWLARRGVGAVSGNGGFPTHRHDAPDRGVEPEKCALF